MISRAISVNLIQLQIVQNVVLLPPKKTWFSKMQTCWMENGQTVQEWKKDREKNDDEGGKNDVSVMRHQSD